MRVCRALAVVVLFVEASSTILSSSQLYTCYEYGNGTQRCEVTTAVLLEQESISRSREAIVVKTAKDDEGHTRPLEEPLAIVVETKLAMQAYDLKVLRDFNGKPREKTHYAPYRGCDADASSPLCGYYTTKAGERIRYSSGFCCRCTMAEMTGLESKTRRGNPGCGLRDSGDTAHCIEFDPTWFRGCEVLGRHTVFDVAVNIGNTTTLRLTSLEGGAEQRVVSPEGVAVTAKVVTGFPADTQDLTGRVALLPTGRADLRGLPWLHVPRSMVTLDGRECNKIGVSFEAFWAQPERCRAQSGSCLSNQILDLIAEDHKRVEQRKERPLYLGPRNMGGHSQLVLETKVKFLVSVEVVAPSESVSFSVNVGLAVVEAVDAPPFADYGTASVAVVNTGSIAASFRLTVEEAGRGSVSVRNPSTVFWTEPGAEATLSFSLQATVHVPGGSPAVTVPMTATLAASDHSILEVFAFNVTLLPHSIDKGSQEGLGTDTAGNVLKDAQNRGKGSGGDGEKSCTNCPWYNPLCFIGRRCFLQSVLMLGLTVGGIVGAVWMVKKGYAAKLAGLICGACTGSKERTPTGSGVAPTMPYLVQANPLPVTFPHAHTAPPLGMSTTPLPGGGREVFHNTL